jgi:chromosome segregation ATPase
MEAITGKRTPAEAGNVVLVLRDTIATLTAEREALRAKVAQQVEELNTIIRQKWEIEGQLERCAKSVKALVSERDMLRTVVDAARVVAETTTPFPVYGMGHLRDAIEDLSAWEKRR